MTVGELITELEWLPLDLEVCMPYDDYDKGIWRTPVAVVAVGDEVHLMQEPA